MSDGGKGSAPRPLSVNDETFTRNFEAIFGKRHDKNQDNTSPQCSVAQARTNPETEAKEEKKDN